MFQSLLSRVASGLEQGAIPYMVIGGQAVALYGEVRLTKDIDITLGVDAGELSRVLEIIGTLQMRPAIQEATEFVRQTNVLPAVDEVSGIRVDFVFSFSPYERQAIARSHPVKIHETNVHYATAEDLIIHKVVAGRPRDIEDVRGILSKSKTIDLAYVEKWLKSFEDSLRAQFVSTFRILQKESS